MQYKSKIAKNKRDKFVNILTSSVLIAYNGKIHMSTNMTIFKPPKYSCF